MLDLNEKYLSRLQEIAEGIQNSEAYAAYLDTEEEAEYKVLCDIYEPRIAKIYAEVAANDPLQLISLERILLNPYFEGLFLQRILGFSVLRGQINDQFKYVRPQNHFKEILTAILESSNFEFIKKRIGQSVQMGFALSSDIWITDFINDVVNKRLRYYLQSNKLDKFRELHERELGFQRYQAQFDKDNFLTANFPNNFSALKVEYPELKNFLMYRIGKRLNNVSLLSFIVDSVKNEALQGTSEHIQLMCLTMNFFNLEPQDTEAVRLIFNKLRVEIPEFSETYLSFINDMQEAAFDLDAKAEMKASTMIDREIQDDLTEYYRMADIIHTQDYESEDVMQVVKQFYYNHEGLSTVNESVRRLIFGYIQRVITNLKTREYPQYFEISKTFSAYMGIFQNEHFNQNVRDISLDYIHKCLVKFIDKRAKEYQEVKRFVATYFEPWHFLKEKEIVEMFKTRRKRKTTDV